jgi:hypothetical protein
MLEWSDYVDNAERNAKLEITERWTVNGVNALLAWHAVEWAGYGRGWMSALIFFGVWFGLTGVWSLIASEAASRSWSSEAYLRKIEDTRREEDEHIRWVCRRMLHDTGLLKRWRKPLGELHTT